jgi:hypothetical protein
MLRRRRHQPRRKDFGRQVLRVRGKSVLSAFSLFIRIALARTANAPLRLFFINPSKIHQEIFLPHVIKFINGVTYGTIIEYLLVSVQPLSTVGIYVTV